MGPGDSPSLAGWSSGEPSGLGPQGAEPGGREHRYTWFIAWPTPDLGGLAPLWALFPQVSSGEDNDTYFLLVTK